MFGQKTEMLRHNAPPWPRILLVLLLIPCIIFGKCVKRKSRPGDTPPGRHAARLLLSLPLFVCIPPSVGAVIYCNKQKKLTAQMNRRMEELEFDVRNDIRQGR